MPGGLTIRKGLSRGRHFLFSLFPIFLALLLVTLVTAKAACNYNVLRYFRGAAHCRSAFSAFFAPVTTQDGAAAKFAVSPYAMA